MGDLAIGARGAATVKVVAENTALALGSGDVPVFATPALVALMENASVEAVQKYLPPGQTSVGTEVHIKHLAATPVGMHAHARSTVTAVDGRRITFQVEAWDDREKIGEGTHTRVVIDEARFNERLAKKV